MTERRSSLAALRKIVGSDNTRDDGETLGLYAVEGLRPWAVVFPESSEEISDVIRLAARENLSVVPWGSGSKISKGNVPGRLDLVLCTERLNKILDMDMGNLTLTAQAGVRFDAIQAALAGEENRCDLPYTNQVTSSDVAVCSDRANMGCFVPLMPPHTRTATLGGIIAANASGPTRLLHGLLRDLVLGVRYVASNGEIVGMGGKTVKNVSGYDVCKLMVGSHGSLGILCEMTLRILPLPERLATGLFSFQTLDGASRFVARIFDSRLLPAAVELMDGRAWGFLGLEGGKSPGRGGYGVAVAMEGVDEAVGRMNSEIKEWALEAGALETRAFQEEADRCFWEAYCNQASRLSDEYPNMVSVKLNYPVSVYAEIVEFAEASAPMDLTLFCHAGSGISRIHCLVAGEGADLVDRTVSFLRGLLDRCAAHGGNMVIERAPIPLKKRLPVWGKPGGDLVVMKRIKEQMDPLGILSPGRFVGGL
ncbi:MAG: FAD-binding oxidoreductase [Proteobacteria bacterium]|nr:FAD-binding oxidoreductase [Pseudomonadota bacterium]